MIMVSRWKIGLMVKPYTHSIWHLTWLLLGMLKPCDIQTLTLSFHLPRRHPRICNSLPWPFTIRSWKRLVKVIGCWILHNNLIKMADGQLNPFDLQALMSDDPEFVGVF